VWAGVDSVWEQKKLEAREMLENAAESHSRVGGQRVTIAYAVALFQPPPAKPGMTVSVSPGFPVGLAFTLFTANHFNNCLSRTHLACPLEL
jgi:hypothetical protein